MTAPSDTWYLKVAENQCYGPERLQTLVQWAEQGRIVPGQSASTDAKHWIPVEDIPELELNWYLRTKDGKHQGPFNRLAAEAVLQSSKVPAGTTLVPKEAIQPAQIPPAQPSLLATEEPPAQPPQTDQPAMENPTREVIYDPDPNPEDLSGTAPDSPPIQHELEAVRNELQKALADRDRLVQETTTLRTELQTIQSQLTNQQAASASLREHLTLVEEERRQAKEQLAELETNAAGAKHQSEAVQAELEREKQQRQQAETALQRAQAELEKARHSALDWQQKLDASDARCRELQQANETLSQSLEVAQNQGKEAQEQLEQERQNRSEKEQTLDAVKAELESLKREHSELLSASNSRDLELQDAIAALQRQVEELQNPEHLAKLADQRDFTQVHELVADELLSLEESLDTERSCLAKIRESSTTRQERLQERIFALRKLLGSDSDEFRRNALHRTQAANTARIMAEVNTYKANCQQEIRELLETREEQARQINLLKAEEARLKAQVEEGARHTVGFDQLKEDLARVTAQLEQERRVRISDQEQFNSIQNSLLKRIDELEQSNPFLSTERRLDEATRAGYRPPSSWPGGGDLPRG